MNLSALPSLPLGPLGGDPTQLARRAATWDRTSLLSDPPAAGQERNPIPRAPGAASAAPNSPERLKAVAESFESLFVTLLLKEMRQTLEPEGGLFAGDHGDILGGLFDHTMGQHLAQASPLGIARLLEKQWGKKPG